MPTIAYDFAPPAYWQAFEDITVGVARVIFNDPSPQKVGRAGQSQKGVDVIVNLPDGRRFGIQCKRRDERDENNNPLPGGAVTVDMVKAAAVAAEAYPARLDRFILATTAKADSGLQGQVAALSDARTAKGKPAVQVWSWADYADVLDRDATLQQAYYEMVPQGASAPARDRRLLDLFAEAFSRPAFNDPLSCEHPDDFLRALSDTQRALSTGDLRDRNGATLRRAAGGWRSLDDEALRAGAGTVADALQTFRVALVEAERAGDVEQHERFLYIARPEVQEELERLRADVADRLTEVLAQAGLPPLRHRR